MVQRISTWNKKASDILADEPAALHLREVRFVAVRRDGTWHVAEDEQQLLAGLEFDTYIVTDRTRWQAVLLRKEPVHGHSRKLPALSGEQAAWLELRELAPGPYLVREGDQRPSYVLVKLPSQWDTVLMRRSACWQAGQELPPDVQAELEGRLSALAREMQVE